MKNIKFNFSNKEKTHLKSFQSIKLLLVTNAFLLLFTSFKYLDKKDISFFLFTNEIAATLELTKSVSKSNVESGETFIYTLQYRCASTTDDCNGTFITDPLPAEVQFVTLVNSTHVASSAYNSGTHTVIFTMIDPLASGTSDQVEIHVKFPNGTTPNGTVASNSATIDASNATAVTTPIVDATAIAVTKTYFRKTASAGGAAGGNLSFTFQICNTGSTAENGTLDLTSISIRDTFPPNTTFISAINAGGTTHVYDAPSHSITYTFPSSIPSGTCYYPKVSLGVPSPPFNVGDVVSNSATVYYSPYGGSVATENISTSATLTTPTLTAYTYKNVSGSSYYRGNGGNYTIGFEIDGTDDFNNFCLVDTIPTGLIIDEIYHGGYYYRGVAASDYVVTISYETNLGGPYTITGSPFSLWQSGSIDIYSDLGLPADDSEYITVINWCYGNMPAGFATYNDIRLDFKVKSDAPLGALTNCAEMTTSTSGVTLTEGCGTFTVNPALSGFRPSIRKYIEESTGSYVETHTESLSIGDTATFRLRVRNSSSAANDLTNPIAADFLPAGLEYVSGSWTFNASGTGAPNPIFSETTNFNGSGRSLLKWSWTGASSFDLPPNESMYVYFDAKVTNEAPPGYNTLIQEFALLNNTSNSCSGATKKTDSDDLDEDGNTTEEFCFKDISLNVNGVVSIESELLIKGQLDSDWTKYPSAGTTVPGGVADYLLEIRNLGNVALDSIVIIDILPFVGDTGVIDLTNRNSRWKPNLVSTVSAPAGVTVYYSTEGNPCRASEGFVTSGPAGCTAPGWTTSPADLTAINSLKFDFGSTTIEARDTFQMQWSMRAPVDAMTTIGVQPDSIAWNSFGFIAQRVDNGDTLLATEPVKVGMKVNPISPNVYGDWVWEDTNGNDLQGGSEPGINGVRVELYKDNGDGIVDTDVDTFINFTLTANGGFYLFPNLTDGDYYSVFYKPLAMDFVANDVGGNDAIDSDGTPTTLNGYDVAITSIVNLNSLVYDLSWDLGLVPSPDGAVGNYVWNDKNGNGIQDESAADGINGVKVYLYNIYSSSQPYAQAITQNDINGNPGYYYFDNVPATDYQLRIDLPSGASFTTQNAGSSTDETDSDIATTGLTTDTIFVTAGTYHSSWDAGLILPTTEICDNGLDDDGDGDIDCADSDCSGDDNDGDGICDIYDLDDDNDGILDDLEVLGYSSYDTICSINQFDFSNPTLESGVDETVGAIYRYSNVIAGTDALVEIKSMTNATLDTIDSEDATGFLDAFQPIIISTATGTVGIEFNFKFVNTGTTTLNTSLNRIGGTAYDLDGTLGSRMESYKFISPSATGLDNPSFLQIENIGSDVEFTANGIFEGLGIDPDPRLRVYFLYKDTSEFTVHVQQKVVSGLGAIFYSLRFDECEVSDFESINLYVSEGVDTDGDGVDNHLDLDSDNDGIFDVDEAGHTAVDANDDGIIDGANALFGTNGVFDALETFTDSDSLNYAYADSEITKDSIFDFWEIDADADGCFDAEEENVSDSDADGIAGTGTPTVDANGLVTSITYGSPPNNFWKNPAIGVCLPEICGDGIDNNADGNVDDFLSISNIAIGGCYQSGGQSWSDVDIEVSWYDIVGTENIIIDINGNTQTINPSISTSPTTVQITMLADGSLNNPVIAFFQSTTTCADTVYIAASVSCPVPFCVGADPMNAKTFNVWHTGNGGGLDFNQIQTTGSLAGYPSTFTQTGTPSNMTKREGGATYCHPITGEVLIYSDGEKGWDSAGNEYSTTDVSNRFNTAATNLSSAAGTPLIIASPGQCDMASELYIFFTDDHLGATPELYYAIVDVPNKTISNPVQLTTGSTSEQINAVQVNCDTIWLVYRDNKDLNAIRWTTAGFETPIVSSDIHSSNDQRYRSAFSMDATRFAMTIGANTDTLTEKLTICDFDYQTGQFSNPFYLQPFRDVPDGSNLWQNYGVVFSPDGSKLYTNVSTGNGYKCYLMQYDLEAGTASAIQASMVTLDSISESGNGFGGMMNAPDGRIYISAGDGSNDGINNLHVLDFPNQFGILSGFQTNVISPGGATGAGLNNIVYGLGPAACIPSILAEIGVDSCSEIILTVDYCYFGSGAPYDIYFKLNGSLDSIMNQNPVGNQINLSGLSVGKYTDIFVLDAKGCASSTDSIILAGTTCAEDCTNGLDDDLDSLTDCDDDDCTPLANNAILNTCDNSNGTGTGTFFMHDANPTVSTESGIIISYHPSLSNAQSNINDLISPYMSANTTEYARVERVSTGCFATSEITLNVGAKCAENCNNGKDEDGDGLIDCDDSDCPCCESDAPSLDGVNRK